MIPLRDEDRDRSYFPLATILLIILNCIVFYTELQQGPGLDHFIERWATIPVTITHGQSLITLVSAMFLHSGWFHITGNMLFLWVFGINIEDSMGPIKFICFYFICGLAAAAAQIALDPNSSVPMLGASGAIAGVLGAFLVAFPRDRILTLIFFGFGFLTRISAGVVIVFWFVLQLLPGLGEITTHGRGGGIAYVAHIGGFIAGLLLVRLFGRRIPPHRYYPSRYVT